MKLKTKTIVLSVEAAEVLRGMAAYCIDNGYCMGIDEGITKKRDRKKRFRIELEKFAFSEISQTNKQP